MCIADASKLVQVLGRFPLPVEVIPMARNYVARELVKLGGRPVWRETVVTDKVADAIMSVLAEKYFETYATVAWITPTQVMRPNRF